MKSFKKLAITLLSVLTVACGAAGLAACLPTDVLNSSTSSENAVSSESVSTDEESGENDDQESASGEDSTDGKENEITKHEETSYLRMETNQASQTVENENGEQTTYEAELIETYREGELYFLRYKIGEIKDFFIRPEVTPICWEGKALPDITYTKSTLEVSSISKGLSSAISTTDSTSVTQTGKETASWSFSESSSFNASLEVELGVAATGRIQAELEAGWENLENKGTEREDATSEEVASSFTKAINDSYEMKTLREEYEEMQFYFPSSMWYDYEPGY